MSSSVNTVLLLGHLGADPEQRATPSGRTVTEFRIATNRWWRDNTGSRQEETEWHRVVTWGRTAELAAQYLRRGRQVFVEGRLKTDRWTDREGRDRSLTKVVATRVVFLGRGSGEAGAESAPNASAMGGPQPGERLFGEAVSAGGGSAPIEETPF